MTTKSKRNTPYHRDIERNARARRERILSLVERGYSYTQIGAMLTPQISRQRVGQIVAGAK